jgi:hypothetical protein
MIRLRLDDALLRSSLLPAYQRQATHLTALHPLHRKRIIFGFGKPGDVRIAKREERDANGTIG